MTAETRDSSADLHHHGHPGSATGGTAAPHRRPRWLLPTIAAVAIATALVLLDIISLSTAFYAGLVGGMLLMHLGGHGHGHGGHADEGTSAASGAGDTAGNDDTDGSREHDQQHPSACH